MARKGTTRAMSDKHEEHLIDVLGGVPSPGSGNQAAKPLDGRHSRMTEKFAFAWDAKSTLADSISVSRNTWDKIVRDAHGERPLMPIRFYDTQRLDVGLDLVVLDLNDFVELLEAARSAE